MSYESSPQVFTAELLGQGHYPPEGKVAPTSQEWVIPQTANTIVGFNTLNLSNDMHFSAMVAVDKKSEDRIGASIGGLNHSHLYAANARIMSFFPSDTRVQTGMRTMASVRFPGVLATPGEGLCKQIAFARPFKSAPRVAVFISKLDCDQIFARAATWATDAAPDKACLWFKTWHNTKLYDLGVHFVAHEADDPTIRSGSFGARNVPEKMSHKGSVQYDTPLPETPRGVMYGFSYIDTRGDAVLRISASVTNVDRNGFDWELFTPSAESMYYELKCSYLVSL